GSVLPASAALSATGKMTTAAVVTETLGHVSNVPPHGPGEPSHGGLFPAARRTQRPSALACVPDDGERIESSSEVQKGTQHAHPLTHRLAGRAAPPGVPVGRGRPGRR